MTMTNYPNGFANGVTIRNMPLLAAYPGDVFWVSSTAGSSNGKGTFQKPLATIAQALDLCTASAGDIIVLKPGHSETVTAAAGLAIDVAGVAIIGLGAGSLRPTINFTTVVGADMDIDAANVTMANMLFTGGIDALTGPIDINAADCTLVNIETRDATGQAVDFIVTDDNCDRLKINGWKHLGAAAAGADTAITLVGGDDWEITNFDIYGNFAVAAIENVTTAANRIKINNGFAETANSADVLITMVATTTGFIGPYINGRLADNAANITEALVGADCQFMQPINLVNLDGESSMQTNITASTDA